jgi:uncharacterized protein (DUF58 family)
MKREKIRLRPTGLWLIFGPVLGCMWLAAVNYSNNLIYAILYLIGSLTFISIFHSWRNLASVEVDHIRINSAFAGKEVSIEIYLRASRPVYGLHFSHLGEERYFLSRRSIARWIYRAFFARFGVEFPRRPAPLPLRGSGGLRVAAGDSCCAEVISPAGRRGMYRFETLMVRSSFPFGLIWARFNVPVGAVYYVYPHPKGTDVWPQLRPAGENGSPQRQKQGDDFSGVRVYSPGESLRHVDWKAYARGRPLSVKQFTGGDGQELWLDAAEMARVPLEDRLSQLSLWIVNAEKEEIPYALRLGRTTLPIGLGPAQSRRALETLAVAGLGLEER